MTTAHCPYCGRTDAPLQRDPVEGVPRFAAHTIPNSRTICAGSFKRADGR